MKRRHELICRAEFETLLAKAYPHLKLVWDEPPQDPPDWYLQANGKRYAVEATSITEIFTLAGNRIPSPSVSVSLAGFVDYLERSARDRGILSGSYLVCLAPIPELSTHKAGLEDQFLNYIADTKTVPTADLLHLGFVGHDEISIQKIGPGGNYVAEAISFEAKSGSEAQKELHAYLEEAITVKTHKLRDVPQPRVLLVLDDFHYSPIADWRVAIKAIPSRNAFRVVVRIAPPNNTEVIWPETVDWLA